MEQHKAKFKVRDMVTVVEDYTVNKDYFGKTGTITRITTKPYPYKVDFGDLFDVFNEEELDHSKEHKVLTILREYEKRKNTNLSGQESRG